MNTVFVGGSRHVSRLPDEARERLENVIRSGFPVIVGDANGADKAIQKYLLDRDYKNVTVFCSGSTCRNNLGHWATSQIRAPQARGFQFYAAKDREMAREAEFGLMIWDGKSPGTVLNVLRLVRAGKKAVLLNVHGKTALTFKEIGDWDAFLAGCNAELKSDLVARATPEEWEPERQADLLVSSAPETLDDASVREINEAFASGEPARILDKLGHIAKARGMSQVSKHAGLARESLYRSLAADGNPEFTTVLKILSSVGLSLSASRTLPHRGR